MAAAAQIAQIPRASHVFQGLTSRFGVHIFATATPSHWDADRGFGPFFNLSDDLS